MTLRSASRRQLALFVPSAAAVALEAIRRRVDPVQHRLIPAHVTLCRDEELADRPIDELCAELAMIRQPPLTLEFGPAETSTGHGVLLPCIAGELAYHELRVALLQSDEIRPYHPHITLAHPRNPHALENVASAYDSLPRLLTIRFERVSLIEQVDGQPWAVMHECNLSGDA
jgi:2'-5' RNA ligase